MNKLNRVFFFDVDGTLSCNGKIPTSAIETLKGLKHQEDILILSTGRCLGQLKEVYDLIPFDGAITNNGAYICYNEEELDSTPISKEMISEFVQCDLCTAVLTKDEYGVLNPKEDILQLFCSYFHIPLPKVVELQSLGPVYSLGVYALYSIEEYIQKFSSLHFIKVNPYGYDVILKGVSKGKGIEVFRKKFPNHKFYGFGDDFNDIEMLDRVDISIVMGTAPMEVKAHATYVTKDPLEDGIQYAVKEILKI